MSDHHQAMIRVLAVDDHPMMREGVAAIIDRQSDMTMVGAAENGTQAIDLHSALRPDITLMDLQMPDMSGIDAIQAIRAAAPLARIIVLTTFEGDHRATAALRAGAAGYLLKGTPREDLLNAIRDVHAGRRRIVSQVAEEIAMFSDHETLSARESEVLSYVARGKPNKIIAAQLNIAEDTVKTHLKRVFEKLDVADRTEAVTVAAKRGIIDI